MPVKMEADGAEDVKDFLQRIKEMGDQRDKEDEERTKKLEEEILQGRKERQARRNERAMSLSPTKETSTHSGTPVPARSYHDSSVLGDQVPSPPLLPSRQRSAMDDVPQKQNGGTSISEDWESIAPSREMPLSPSKSPNTLSTSPSVAMAPSRSSTLSWQQRPSSHGATLASAKHGPLASEKAASKLSRPDFPTAPESDNSVSRSQIAQSLSAKHATFFKQTQDRGIGSAAYRKGQIDDPTNAGFAEVNRKLPGMSREGAGKTEPHEDVRTEGTNTDAPSAEGSFRDSSQTRDGHQLAASKSSTGAFHNTLPAPSIQRLEHPSSDASSSFESGDSSLLRRTMAMSPSQGRISTEPTDRPASPTKGLGGFVQSAMMKRSDSINKRWSAQAGPGLSRENSLASDPSGSDGMRYTLGGATLLAESRNSSISREATPNTASRPTSSQTSATISQFSLPDQTSTSGSSWNKDSEHSHGTSEPTSQVENTLRKQSRPSSPIKGGAIMNPPSSPSKRWSPTKSSWLEHAISKPEPPKVLSPSAPQQPAWMADYYRNKQQRGSVDLDKGPTFKEVTVNGLVRSPPAGTGYKAPSVGGLPKGFASGVALGSRTGNSSELRYSESLESSESSKQPNKFSDSSTSPNPSDVVNSASSSPATVLDSSQKDVSISRVNTKPETPPKKDFQVSLKPQQKQRELQGKIEPEFKNVFGKLKKTQMQNYVAPDELKDNIMRGKTGLAKTDGPQKSNVKDHFKESILKKKEDMIAPSASTKITSAVSRDSQASTPEALAKRQQLGKSESIASARKVENAKPPPKPESLAKLQALQDKSVTVASGKQRDVPTAMQQAPENPKMGINVEFASSLAGILQKGPSPSGAITKPLSTRLEEEGSSRSTAGGAGVTQQSPGGPELTHATKGRARGPKRKPPSSTQPTSNASHTTVLPGSASKPRIAEMALPRPTSTLAHEASPDGLVSRPLATITNDNNSNGRKTSQPSTPRSSSTSVETALKNRPSPAIAQASVDELSSKAPAVIAQNSAQISGISEVQKTVASTPSATTHQLQDPLALRDSMQKLRKSSHAQGLEENQSQQTIKNKAGARGQSPVQTQSIRSKQSVGLSAWQDGSEAVIDARLPNKEAIGLGIDTPQGLTQVSHQGAVSGSPALAKPSKSPPLPGRKPATTDIRPIATPPPPTFPAKGSLPPSDDPPASAIVFRQIFDKSPSPRAKINIDTQAVLDKPPSQGSEKIKTLRKQIFEISGNGKTIPVPSQQEHILFENSLYVCTHVFGTSAGTRTSEVYLWCGDGVSPSSIEDAQLFAKKTARENGGRLMMLQQGKETSNFFQALGGIVITRKGSNSRSDSAIYMLCGRRHLGQIAFDEVDFHPQSLCSGFPYIISARGGRLYLWKGNGASADELGCARLIGMDLGLTGEIEEIDEGREPSDFWSSFPTGSSKPKNSAYDTQHWGLKPSCERYTTKLFTIDVETSRPKSSSGFMSWGRRGSAPIDESGIMMETKIMEVTPFTQADLLDEGVFLLDTFFEIFVIHPLRTSLNPALHYRSPKATSFYAALLFAQEYGILVASAEDRPFVPHGSVVVIAKNDGGPKALGEGEAPDGLKRCFRKWDVRGTGGGNVNVLSLTEALTSLGSWI